MEAKQGWSKSTLRQFQYPTTRKAALAKLGHQAIMDQSLVPADYATEGAANGLIENCVGICPVPLGLAEHFLVNGVERLVPMATEERSVIAAAAYGAGLCRRSGGFKAEAGPPILVGQALFGPFPDCETTHRADRLIFQAIPEMLKWAEVRLKAAERHDRGLISAWTAVRGEELVVVNFNFDVGETMGANFVTRWATEIGRHLADNLGLPLVTGICSNASGRRVTVSAVWEGINPAVRERIRALTLWAGQDPTRAATHNKGLMNGVEAVCLATGQDTRAILAANLQAASPRRDLDGRPLGQPLSLFQLSGEDAVSGQANLILPVGTYGGATRLPAAVACREIMGVADSKTLAEVVAAVGLASNFAALRCLADEGITEAHRRLRR